MSEGFEAYEAPFMNRNFGSSNRFAEEAEFGSMTLLPSQYRSASGNTRQGTIKTLDNPHAGFKDRDWDGRMSQTGLLQASGGGYQGSFEPITSLMRQNGYTASRAASTYIYNTDLPPSTQDNQGLATLGVQPVFKTIIGEMQGSQLLPPMQGGLPNTMQRSGVASDILAMEDSNVVDDDLGAISVPVYNQASVSTAKFSAPGDPNPLYPLAPLDPADMQATTPARVKPGQALLPKVDPGAVWNGKFVSVGQKNEAGKQVWTGAEQPAGAESSAEMLRMGVDNYLWDRNRKMTVTTG